MTEKQYYKVEAELLQAIANYLAERPFKEVNGLIAGLNTVTKIDAASAEVTEAGAAQC